MILHPSLALESRIVQYGSGKYRLSMIPATRQLIIETWQGGWVSNLHEGLVHRSRDKRRAYRRREQPAHWRRITTGSYRSRRILRRVEIDDAKLMTPRRHP